MTIEQANVNDAAEILKLQKLAYQSEAVIYSDYTIPPLIQTLEEIQNDFSTHTFLKASSGEKIIGSVKARILGGTCFIGRLIVHPGFQNQGIGTRLMHEIEKRLSDAERFELFTGSKSERNLYLYQKLGYQIFKREAINENIELVYLEKLATN